MCLTKVVQSGELILDFSPDIDEYFHGIVECLVGFRAPPD